MKAFLFAVLMIPFGMSAQEGVDYQHRQLDKQIHKSFGTDHFILEAVDSTAVGQDPIAQAGKFFKLKQHSQLLGHVYVGRVNTCRAGGCSSSSQLKSAADAFEYFDYFILFNLDNSVRHVQVFDYRATHGHEVCSRPWLKQFRGYDGEKELRVGKDIDGISGATISVHAITFNIETVSKLLSRIHLVN